MIYFINWRGKVRELRWDGGKNVMGGKNEFSVVLKEVKIDLVKNFFFL